MWHLHSYYFQRSYLSYFYGTMSRHELMPAPLLRPMAGKHKLKRGHQQRLILIKHWPFSFISYAHWSWKSIEFISYTYFLFGRKFFIKVQRFLIFFVTIWRNKINKLFPLWPRPPLWLSAHDFPFQDCIMYMIDCFHVSFKQKYKKGIKM